MHNHGSAANCLNCNQPVQQNFCAHCGQKASTHRYSVHHFLVHDLVHGIWHLDKGLLFTVKELFTRPGHSTREFIEGRRVRHFNYFTLIVLITGLGLFLSQLSPFKLTDIFPENTKALMSEMEQIMTKYPKLVPLIMIPFNALLSFAWFYRARLNLTEHVILNAYKVCGELMLGLLFSVIMLVYPDKAILYTVYNGVLVASTLYGVWFYYQYFSAFSYKKSGLLFRSIMIPLSAMIAYMLIGIISALLSMKK
ncbi:DUF3667 domain-containing protein [Nostoc ellipsosporum NOK]|nr:DUF3667 domain-containing protein [Nostoc ellipsosporum NOK]